MNIAFSEIPLYLHDSALYEIMKEEGEGHFEISPNCCKMDFEISPNCCKMNLKIESESDFFHLLNTLRYWGVNALPNEISYYIMQMGGEELYAQLENDFYDLPFFEEIKFLLKSNREDLCTAFANNGKLNLLKFAHENGYPWDEETCRAAAKGGHLDCLIYAHEHGCPWSESICYAAEYNNRVDCLRYAHEHGCPWAYAFTHYDAATDGRLEVIKYLYEYECGLIIPHRSWGRDVCAAAAYSGQLECLQFLHEHECPWHLTTTKYAAETGNVNCLKYAIENDCPYVISDLYRLAAVNGHLHILQYLCEFELVTHNRISFCDGVCSAARKNGHLECLQFLHENGFT